jgi:hypothetical protein
MTSETFDIFFLDHYDLDCYKQAIFNNAFLNCSFL